MLNRFSYIIEKEKDVLRRFSFDALKFLFCIWKQAVRLERIKFDWQLLNVRNVLCSEDIDVVMDWVFLDAHNADSLDGCYLKVAAYFAPGWDV